LYQGYVIHLTGSSTGDFTGFKGQERHLPLPSKCRVAVHPAVAIKQGVRQLKDLRKAEIHEKTSVREENDLRMVDLSYCFVAGI